MFRFRVNPADIGSRDKNKQAAVLLPVFGFLAGMMNGLFGAGGGILVVYVMTYLLRGTEGDKRDIYANALCAMLPVTAVTCVRYALAGHLSVDGFSVYALPAILGGICGGLLLGRLKAGFVKKLFAVLVLCSGLLLILR